MVSVKFEHEDNVGTLYLKTHFGTEHKINCTKNTDEIFRLGGTIVNETVCYEGVILNLLDKQTARFRAFCSVNRTIEDKGFLSFEGWESETDFHCYVTEYYPLDIEGKPPSWLISRMPIKDANYIFVNLDVLDGGSNVIKRYRISPFFGTYKIMENL